MNTPETVEMQFANNNVIQINIEDVNVRADLYPRIKHDPALAQRYFEDIEKLPPIEINQNGILIDGFHRYTAHRMASRTTISAIVTETDSDRAIRRLANKRNNKHGWQLDETSKRREAVWLYANGQGDTKEQIADALSVSMRSVNSYLSDTDRQLREERKQRIFDMWLACHTQDEIADAVGMPRQRVADTTKELPEFAALPKPAILSAEFIDTDFDPPLYNTWTFAKKSNAVSHFGNSEQRILENLLYLYTEPFDIVVDPFAGGGSTIDVCKRRLRRYFVSDRKPIIARENEIRLLDVATDVPPLNKRWSEVALTYLDPPYWKQAEGQYSSDAEDLANMPLTQFTEAIVGVVNRIADRQSHGAIALLIQPTQWKSDNRAFTDHVMHITSAVKHERLTLENRVSCPYSTEQYNAQQVEWAKANKKLLVLTRELIIWRVGE